MRHDQIHQMGGHEEMQSGDHLEMTRQMREKWLWPNCTVILRLQLEFWAGYLPSL